jgi:tetratricopeptide (TPR) repeat protein
LGIALAEKEQTQEAIAALRNAAALDPGNAAARYNLGLALAKAGETAPAVAEFRKAVELTPLYPEARRALGAALQRAGDLQAARVELEAAVQAAPGDAEAFSTLGALLLRVGDTAAATVALEKSIELNPKLIKSYRTLAQAQFKAGRAPQAARLNRQAEQLSQEQADLGRAMLLLDSARQQLARGETAPAVELLRESLALRPDFTEAQLLLARTLRGPRQGSEEALAIVRGIVAANPRHAVARYEKAVTLESLGRQQEALEDYRAAVQLAPSLLDARRALAANALRSQDWCAATLEARAILSWEPGDRQARETLQQARRQVASDAPGCPLP